MVEVKPNLEIWVSGYFYQLGTLNARVDNLEKVVSIVGIIEVAKEEKMDTIYYVDIHYDLDDIKEELALINNGNKTLIDYFKSEIIKEKENGKE